MNMDGFTWEVFRKNIKFIRKHYKLTQEDIADKIGCSRSAYQHCEAKGAGGLFLELSKFWYNSYNISPTCLIEKELTAVDIEKIENRNRFEKLNKRVKVKIKIK